VAARDNEETNKRDIPIVPVFPKRSNVISVTFDHTLDFCRVYEHESF
jgi:hypothetical protein